MKTLYFENQDAEYCYTKEHFIEKMKENNIDSMEVLKAVPDKIDSIFWCKAIGEVVDSDYDPCGKVCENYEPRNGKSGCCKHYKKTLYTHGDKTTIKL